MKKCGGGYIDVPYIEEAVLVNLGALMQRWTSDKYLATVGFVHALPTSWDCFNVSSHNRLMYW